MQESLGIIIIAVVLFLAMILNLGAKPAISQKITGYFLTIAAVSGFLIYGYGYSMTIDNIFLASLRTTLSVSGMYVGRSDLSAISSVEIMSNIYMQIFYWLVHLMALYATASAAITVVGAEALKRLRLALSRRGTLTIIYGTNDEALQFGKECQAESEISVVFVDEQPTANAIGFIQNIGAGLRSDKKALDADVSFFRSLAVKKGKRKINLYCFMDDELKNVEFATKVKDTYAKMDLNFEQTSVVLIGDDKSISKDLQVYGSTYGFGNVSIFNTYREAARLMVRTCPLEAQIEFDENGKAKENFEALVIGFGNYGQSALKQLIMSGQFCGSHFKVSVIANDCLKVGGFIQMECPSLFENYDIQLIEKDARSIEAYRFVEENMNTLKYIVVCTSDIKMSNEISRQMSKFLEMHGKNIPVVQCDQTGITVVKPLEKDVIKKGLYTLETLDFDKIDKMAMALNHYYCNNPEHTMWDDWKDCDYYSRLSSRASADYFPAMLKMLKLTEKDVLKMNSLKLNDVQRDILGQSEHERWCAFHYVNGFQKMSDEVWNERAKLHMEQKERHEKPIPIAKDLKSHIHACLVPWDELDALSAKENAITNQNKDYKQLDIDNVLSIPKIYELFKKG